MKFYADSTLLFCSYFMIDCHLSGVMFSVKLVCLNVGGANSLHSGDHFDTGLMTFPSCLTLHFPRVNSKKY